MPALPMVKRYHKGRRAPRNLEHLKELAFVRNQDHYEFCSTVTPPAAWDSRALGWVPPIKDQAQCGCMPGTDEVLTVDGWQRWQDYDFATPLGTMNQQTGLLEFQAPLQRHVYDYDGPLYYSDNRCIDFALTPNHRLFVRKWNEARRTLDDHFHFVEVGKLGWYAGLPHATTGWLGTELRQLGVGERIWDGDDFLALVALVISDGFAGASEKGRDVVSFCCFREDRIDMVRQQARKMGFHERPSRPGVWTLTDGALAEWFRQSTYTGDVFRSPFKHVPQLVKVSSQRQIEHFLKFFGDQHSEEGGCRRFYSSSRLMVDDLQELLLRIGKRGTIEERDPRDAFFQGRRIESHGPDLTLTERTTNRLSIDRKRNLHTDHYKGQVFCATVPNSTLVTRRNGSVLISGNSCWCFSGVGTVEIALIKAGLLKADGTQALSEEYVLDCLQNGGCNGDDNTSVLIAAKANGLPFTSDYGPYTAGSGSTGTCRFTPAMKLNKIDDWGFADSQQGQGVTPVDDIKAAIMATGCVGAAIAADDAFMNNPAGTVFLGSGSTEIDHDIVLVGWDDSKGPHGAWILRNSWGASWSDAGYTWIAYGANQVGTEAVFARVGAVPPVPIPPPVPPALTNNLIVTATILPGTYVIAGLGTLTLSSPLSPGSYPIVPTTVPTSLGSIIIGTALIAGTYTVPGGILTVMGPVQPGTFPIVNPSRRLEA